MFRMALIALVKVGAKGRMIGPEVDWDLFVDVARWTGNRWWRQDYGSGQVLAPGRAIMRIRGVGPATRDVILNAAWREAFRRLWP
jgi:hypothetical protein